MRGRCDIASLDIKVATEPRALHVEQSIERLNKEIKRRADVVEIFPNPAAFLRLATAVVIGSHDEWQVTRRYVSDVSMDELKAVIATKKRVATHEVTTESLTPELETA